MDTNTRVSDNHQGRKDKQKGVRPSLAVTDAKWLRDYIVQVFFNDGTQQEVDFSLYLVTHPHPYTDPFKDPERFKTFYVDRGNLVWGENWDMIFPTWKLHRGYLD